MQLFLASVQSIQLDLTRCMVCTRTAVTVFLLKLSTTQVSIFTMQFKPWLWKQAFLLDLGFEDHLLALFCMHLQDTAPIRTRLQHENKGGKKLIPSIRDSSSQWQR